MYNCQSVVFFYFINVRILPNVFDVTDTHVAHTLHFNHDSVFSLLYLYAATPSSESSFKTHPMHRQ